MNFVWFVSCGPPAESGGGEGDSGNPAAEDSASIGDIDGDGYAASDCDDTDPLVNPGAVESCNDRVDNDCDGSAGSCTNGSGSIRDADVSHIGSASQVAGTSLGGGRDLDRDGFADLLVGAPSAIEGGRYDPGRIFVLAGGVDPVAGRLEDAVRLYPDADGATVGEVSPVVGDLDGDALLDVLIPVTGAAIVAYIVPAGSAMGGGALGALGLTIEADPGDSVGASALAGLDVDADGLGDAILGGPGSILGDAWILWGAASMRGGPISDLATRVSGDVPGGQFGTRIGHAADVNGDGNDDFLAVSAARTPNTAAWLIGGGDRFEDGPVDFVATARWEGTADEGFYRAALGGGGDLDADGYADVVLPTTLTTYVMRGGAHPEGGSIDGADAALLFGERLGASQVSGGSDIDGDGRADVLIGAYRVDADAGATWLIYGPDAVAGGLLDEVGIRFSGENPEDHAGQAVDFAGDFNGDGVPDIAIGVPGSGDGGEYSGKVALIFGVGM